MLDLLGSLNLASNNEFTSGLQSLQVEDESCFVLSVIN